MRRRMDFCHRTFASTAVIDGTDPRAGAEFQPADIGADTGRQEQAAVRDYWREGHLIRGPRRSAVCMAWNRSR